MYKDVGEWMVDTWCINFEHFPRYMPWSFHVISVKLRWNEMKLAELRREMEDSVASRQRSSRLDNWKRLAAEAALSNNATVSIPDRIESLDLVESKFSYLNF